MKKFNKIKGIALLALLLSMLLVACYPEQSKEYTPEVQTYPEITFTEFSPTTGYPGTPVTITGTNFGETKQAATISFQDVDVDIDIEIVSYTDTEIVVLVPEYAGTGTINLKVWTNEAESSAIFTYLDGVEVDSYSTTEAVEGDQISIYGNNFGTDASTLTVYFSDNIEATIESITDTELVVTVPDEGVTGPISVVYDNGERESSGPDFIYLDPSIVYDDFLEANPEFGGSLDRSDTQASGFWPSTQPINAIGDREWGNNGNNQSGRDWGYVTEGSGELSMGPARGFTYDISDDTSSGYTKPTLLTLEANVNLGTFNNNTPPRPHRGILLGYVSELENSGNPHTNFRGIILTPDSNEIFLWDGAVTDNNNFAGIERVDVSDFISDYDRDADHNLKLVVDTTTGLLVSFEIDGNPFTFSTSPNFSDANTKYMMIGGGSNGSTAIATCYDVRLY